ncbi:MAG: NAD(P)H-dependent oxidoreductase [Verrucomicrobiota bacterium]
MKKILIIGASNSITSINRSLATFAGSLLSDTKKVVLDLNDYEMPIYSPERESSGGVPDLAQQLVQLIESSDGVILSLAEHNGSYSAAFKNILDWASRHKQKLWSEKAMLLLSTSPGQRGASTVLSAAEATFPHLGAKVVTTFSLPSFHENFSREEGVTDAELLSQLKSAVTEFSKAL